MYFESPFSLSLSRMLIVLWIELLYTLTATSSNEAKVLNRIWSNNLVTHFFFIYWQRITKYMIHTIYWLKFVNRNRMKSPNKIKTDHVYISLNRIHRVRSHQIISHHIWQCLNYKRLPFLLKLNWKLKQVYQRFTFVPLRKRKKILKCFVCIETFNNSVWSFKIILK